MNTTPSREEALFQAAAGLASAERTAFLDRECAGDPAVRARLDALLAAHDRPDTLPGEQGEAVRPTIGLEFAEAPDEAVGQTIGRYKLLEKLGEGGCGVVYVAEQTEPVRRRVALKVIKLGMDTKQVVARFEAERQALAMMDHPNIAKVLDAGTTDPARSEIRDPRSEIPAGRPYFVMELVRGIKITDYCDQANLTTQERLDLFIKVCQAIQHAHQKGIIHRDIKPSNILVTLHDGVPVPKVIDFGIAKATEGRLTEATVYTQLHQFIGTPAYMSPEQAEMSGLDIDTRSDIYSLGVLLYELLTGRTPFDAKELMSQGLDAMRRTIREQEPVRPSTRLSQILVGADVRRLQPSAADQPVSEEEARASSRRLLQVRRTIALLQGDLDWIVMKCLEKDRARRYETANGLAADLKRHLSNEPVVARPPSTAYRFQKAFRRHKLAFTAGAAVALALVGGLGVSLWQADEARQARDVADSARISETQQRLAAEAAQQQTETERARAQSALERETTALAVATRANQALEDSLSKEQRSAYVRGIALAQQEWVSDHVARADSILKETGPEDLRGFEWYYLRGLCQGRGALRFEGTLEGRGMFGRARGSGATHPVMMPGGTGIFLDAATREEIFRPAPGSSLTNWSAFAVSSTGDVVAVAERSDFSLGVRGRILVWDRRSQQEPRAIAVPPLSIIHSLAPSPDSGLAGIRTDIHSLALSPDGQLVAAGFEILVRNPPGWSKAGGYVAWWDVASGELQHATPAISNAFWRVAFTPEGNRIVSSGQVGSLDVWETTTGARARTLGLGLGALGVFGDLWALSPDGQHVALRADQGSGVRFVDLRTGEATLGCFGHAAPISAVAYSQDGRWFVAGSYSGSVRVWDATTYEQLGLFRHPWSVYAISFSADSRGLFVGGQAEYLVWDLAVKQDHRELKYRKGSVRTTTFSPDMQLLASGTHGSSRYDGEVVLWDLANNRPSATLRGHKGGVCRAAFSPADHRIATGGEDRTVRIWDRRSGELLCSASDHGQWVGAVAYSPDGGLLASASGDGTVKVRNGHSAQVVFEFLGHKSAGIGFRHTFGQITTTVIFSPDGREIASAGYDGRVRVWDPTNGHERHVLHHEGRVSCVAYRPDGQVLATCTEQGEVKLWDAESGENILEIKGYLGGVSDVAFSPDGQRIATTSGGTVRIFDAISGLEMLALEGGGAAVAFSPDGRFLAAGGSDGTVRLWDGTPSLLDAQLREFHEVLKAPGLAHETRVQTLLKRSELLAGANFTEAARKDFLEASILPRDPQTPLNLIDLSAHYNASLSEPWHTALHMARHMWGISLDSLPTGRQRFAGVEFDIRGLIQVGASRPTASGAAEPYLRRIKAVPIGRRCDRLHFLHAAIGTYATPDGTTIGSYTLRYADGRKVELPVRKGIEVADWWNQPNEEGKPFTVAWIGGDERTRAEGRWLRLFKTTWENPTPGIEVRTLDFTTDSRQAVPFLVALTAE